MIVCDRIYLYKAILQLSVKSMCVNLGLYLYCPKFTSRTRIGREECIVKVGKVVLHCQENSNNNNRLEICEMHSTYGGRARANIMTGKPQETILVYCLSSE